MNTLFRIMMLVTCGWILTAHATPYFYEELNCASLPQTFDFLNYSRIIQPHPAVVEHRILEGIQRYLELTHATLSKQALHVLVLRLLQADSQVTSQIVVQNFISAYRESLLQGTPLENEIDWQEHEVHLRFNRDQLGREPSPEKKLRQIFEMLLNRVGTSGEIISIDVTKSSMTVRVNPILRDHLLYHDGRMFEQVTANP